MKKLYLFNSLTRSKEEFTPLTNGKVGMYVCGPTVYDRPHLGNALSVVIYDLLYRVLNHLYGSENVTYVRNITDVDDKIIAAAKARNIAISALTKEITEIFHQDMNSLSCLRPTIEPKATEHIKEMIEIIQLLIRRGYAYIVDDHVYFAVRKYKDYGKLSGRSFDEMISGARVEVAQAKHDPADFVLWKPRDKKDDDSSVFDSPFGKGRPGWHIECSAMSSRYLGVNFDIHGGGADLKFPHHTNEIAQSCCAYDGSAFAKYWVHNGFLTVNGEKMSKSLGNFITLKEAMELAGNPEAIRYFMLSTHYRKPVDWNEKSIHDAKHSLDNFYRMFEDQSLRDKLPCNPPIPENVLDALLDDLNTPLVLAHLHEYLSLFHKTIDQQQRILCASNVKASMNLIGLLNHDPKIWFSQGVDVREIEQLVGLRDQARKDKNWAESDRIRDQLLSMSIKLEDIPGSPTKWRKT